jgi:hypothetical protein
MDVLNLPLPDGLKVGCKVLHANSEYTVKGIYRGLCELYEYHDDYPLELIFRSDESYVTLFECEGSFLISDLMVIEG